MVYSQKIYKSGNSLAVSIPAEVVHKLGLKPGQAVTLEFDYPSKLEIKFPQALQLPLINHRKK